MKQDEQVKCAMTPEEFAAYVKRDRELAQQNIEVLQRRGHYPLHRTDTLHSPSAFFVGFQRMLEARYQAKVSTNGA